MPEHANCNLCGRDETKLLFRLRDYRLQVDDVEWNVVRCRFCGLGYLNPRPTPDEIGRYYPVEYFEWRAAQTARYRRLATHVHGDRGRLLDIGTARGDFLALMVERGWDVEGIEPSSAAGNPHNLTIHRQRFPSESTLPSGSYDVITAWAVFEHLHDPRSAFVEAARLLRDGGRLVIQVPNLRSVYSRWAKQEDVPRHLHFFTKDTLRRYGNTVGLELVEFRHTTDLFGGSGRGVLRLAFVRMLGKSTSDFFEIWRTPRPQRFRRWPVLAFGWTAIAAVERVVLTDWLVRRARISGQVVAEFAKRRAGSSSSALEDAA